MVRLMTASAKLRIRFIQFPQSQWAELVETLRRSIPDTVEQKYWGTRIKLALASLKASTVSRGLHGRSCIRRT